VAEKINLNFNDFNGFIHSFNFLNKLLFIILDLHSILGLISSSLSIPFNLFIISFNSFFIIL